jgi:PKD repeat protein
LPLKVNFTVSGSDADGDTIVWDLTFGDGNKTNGTSLPKTVSHNYTKAGNFTASLMVTDGKDHTTSNVTIHVAGGGGAGGSQDATVKYTVGQGFCGGTYPAQAAGTDTIFGQLAVDASTYGKAFTADWTFATPGSLGVQVIFKDAAGTTVGDVSNVLVTSLADKVPALAVTAWFSDCGPGGPASVAYHAG